MACFDPNSEMETTGDEHNAAGARVHTAGHPA